MKKLLGVLVVLGISWTVQAAEFPEAMFILDASGSMAEPAGAQTKMAAAKEVLREVVPSMDPEVKIGLAAYGHRNAKDCLDIEILVPPGGEDRGIILSRIEDLQPLGMTPLSEALLQVADTLAGRDAETTLVLVSDGVETCGGDPCEVVEELKKASIRFILHVVGFDVNPAEQAQLVCMAEAGGGRYFSAGDTAALRAALNEIGVEIAEKVEAAKTVVVKQATGLGKVRIAFPESALKGLAGFRIVRKGSEKVVKETEFPGADSTHPLMSGDYSLVLQFANPNYQPPTEMPWGDFTVAKGEVAQVELGALVFNIAPELAKAPVAAVVMSESGTGRELLRILPHGNDYYLFKPKALPPGTVDVALLYHRSEKPAVVAAGLEVTAGKETVLTLDSGLQLVRPEGTKVTGWDLRPAGGGEPVLSVRRGWDNEEPLWRPFPVPPGTYDLHVLVDGMDEALPVGEALAIEAGQTVQFETGL